MGNESNGAVLIAQIKVQCIYDIIIKLKIICFGFKAIFSEAFLNLI